jgi:hypothetical protein
MPMWLIIQLVSIATMPAAYDMARDRGRSTTACSTSPSDPSALLAGSETRPTDDDDRDEDALRPQPSFDLRGCGLSGIVPNVIPLSFLAFEKRAKGDGDLQMLIVLVSRRKCPRIAAMGAGPIRQASSMPPIMLLTPAQVGPWRAVRPTPPGFGR